MKTILRKTLSLFLAFAMLAAVLPAITPTAEATGADVVESFKYDWTAAGVAESEVGIVKIRDEFVDKDFASTWKDYNSSRNWAYISHYPSNSPNCLKYVYIDAEQDTSRYTATGFRLVSSSISSGSTVAWAAFKVKVPAAGTYSISGEFTSATDVDLDIYMAPYTDDLAADAGSVITSSNLIGTMAQADMETTTVGLEGNIDGYTFNQSGDYIMVVKYNHVAGAGYSYLYMRSLTFNREVMRTYSWKFSANGGHSDVGGSWSDNENKYKSYNPDAGRYWAYIGSVVTHNSKPFSQGTEYLTVNAQGMDDYLAFKIAVPEAGKYDAKMTVSAVNSVYSGLMDLYIIPYSAEVEANPAAYTLSKYKAVSGISNYNSELESNARTLSETPFNIEFKSGGDYVLIMQVSGRAGGNHPYIYPSSLIINKTGEATAAETQDVSGADILGEYYAYINDGVLNLYGGVKKLVGYTKVGFEINDGSGWKAISEGTNSVYSTLKGKDGRSVGVTAFGDGCQYVFADSTETEVSGVVSIRAYAVPADEDAETVYGYEYTVTIQ